MSQLTEPQVSGIEEARVEVHPVRRGSPVMWLACAAGAGGAQLVLANTPWLSSFTDRTRPELARVVEQLSGSISGLPEPRVMQAWWWSPCAALGLAALGALIGNRPLRGIICTLSIAVVSVPVVATTRSELSPTRDTLIASGGCCVAILLMVIQRRARWIFALLTALVLVMSAAGTVHRQRTSQEQLALGEPTPDAAALALVDAAQNRDIVRVLTLLDPAERNQTVSVASRLSTHERTIRLIRDTLGLTGAPGEVVITNVIATERTATVTLKPTTPGAGSLVIELLGGLPLQLELVDSRWYISAEATLKALRRTS
jgi:hypothetical protein